MQLLVWPTAPSFQPTSPLSSSLRFTYGIEHFSGVSGWNTEARSRLDDRRGREADDHSADVPLHHLPAESPETRRQPELFASRRQKNKTKPMASTGTRNRRRLPNFGRHVEHQRHDGRVVVAVDDEAHFAEPPAEVVGVLRKLPEAISA